MSALISAAELESRLGDAGLVVLDIRSGADDAGRKAFLAGHIPGARHTDYAADGWRKRVGDVPGLLPDAGHRQALFSRLGLTPDAAIIVVPEGRTANDFAAAARIFWTLQVSGLHPVSILDGGMAGWVADGRALETGPGVGVVASPPALAPRLGLRALAADVEAGLASGSVALVDGRSAAYWRGEEKAAESKAAGHIPGAVNVDYVTAFDSVAGRLKRPAELKALYGAIGEGPVISYCNTGHTAALNWFVLSHVLGRPDVRLYDGSMTDWTQDETRPVSRG